MNSYRKRKMLVCDDDVFVRLLVKQVFEGGEFEILEAENGEAGVEAARQHKPDLIIMDYSMPSMDGYHAIKKIKEDETTASIPVVFLTGLNLEPEIKEKLRKKVVVYLMKPFGKSEIIKAVDKALNEAS